MRESAYPTSAHKRGSMSNHGWKGKNSIFKLRKFICSFGSFIWDYDIREELGLKQRKEKDTGKGRCNEEKFGLLRVQIFIWFYIIF